MYFHGMFSKISIEVAIISRCAFDAGPFILTNKTFVG